jgi:hypothetical protein
MRSRVDYAQQDHTHHCRFAPVLLGIIPARNEQEACRWSAWYHIGFVQASLVVKHTHARYMFYVLCCPAGARDCEQDCT